MASMCVDIGAGMALVMAARAAYGVRTIRDIRQINRGYERLEERAAPGRNWCVVFILAFESGRGSP